MANPTPNWQYPAAPPPYGVAPSATPQLPDSMRQAVWLMWAGTGMAVAYNVVDGLMANSLFTVQTTNTSTYRGATVGGAVVGAVVQVGLWLWMLWKVRAGRSWARVLSTVFFGFLCLGFLISLALGPAVDKIMITAYFVIALSALIMLYQHESSAFFSASERARSPLGSGYPQPGYPQAGYPQPAQRYAEPPPPGEQPPPS